MEITSEKNKPFIIRRNIHKTLLPPESPIFDEGVESNVRFVQGANAFIVVIDFQFVQQVSSALSYMNLLESFTFTLLIRTNVMTTQDLCLPSDLSIYSGLLFP